MTVPSPCISVCNMDVATGYCEGCFRTGAEIAAWPYITDAEKAKIWEVLEKRKAPTP